MQDQDTISNYESSKEWLVRGINKVCDILKPTYGPAGSNVVLEDMNYPFTRVTNDGKLIVDSVILSHPLERMGRNLIAEAADNAQKKSGDGRKTTCLLAQAILSEGIKVKDITPMQLKKEIDECLPIILEEINKNTKQIFPKDVASIAVLASESEDIGNKIGAIYEEIGKDGIIETEASTTSETSYTISDGYRVRNPVISLFSFMEFDDQKGGWIEQQKVSISNPAIIVARDTLANEKQLETIIRTCDNNKISNIVLFVDRLEGQIPNILARLHLSRKFKIFAITSPTLWKSWYTEDVSKLTGATVIDTANGKGFKQFVPSDVGTCEQVIITKEDVRFVGTKDISTHLEALKSQDKEENKLRLSFLQTKVATLRIGADSDAELTYYMKKAVDGCSAAYWALQEGVVKGGGVTLMNISHKIPDSMAGRIMRHALEEPYKIIFDSTKKVPSEIYDATVVVRNAIKNAISIAGIVLTANGAIPLYRPEK